MSSSHCSFFPNSYKSYFLVEWLTIAQSGLNNTKRNQWTPIQPIHWPSSNCIALMTLWIEMKKARKREYDEQVIWCCGTVTVINEKRTDERTDGRTKSKLNLSERTLFIRSTVRIIFRTLKVKQFLSVFDVQFLVDST